MKIRHAITLWVAGAGLAASLVLSLVVLFEMVEQPYKLLDSELNATATYIRNILSASEGHSDVIDEKMLALLGTDFWAKVYDREDRLVFRSSMASHFDLPAQRTANGDGYTVKADASEALPFQPQQGEHLVTFRVKEVKAEPYRIQIAKPMNKLAEEMSDVTMVLIGGLSASSALLIVLSYLVAGRIVRPISVINAMAREINDKTLDTRLPVGKSQDEIFELTKTLNQMFDRLQYSFVKQKELLANASHELKTPIAMLRLFFDEMQQSHKVPMELQPQIASQHSVVLRMERLVKTLLELSVLELKRDLEPEEFDLVALCDSVLTEFSPLIADHHLLLAVTLPPALSLRADKEKIRRLLINLFDNAIKYNVEQGEIRFEVQGDQQHVNLLLSNTFPRIPQGELDKLFDQFYRLEKSRSQQHGGAGLGLAIAKEIVRLHGGDIAIESGPGDWVHLRVIVPHG